MQMGKNSWLKIIALLVIVLVSGLIHRVFIYPKIAKQEAWLIDLTHRRIGHHASVVYFSASPNSAVAPDDTLQKTIHQFASEALPFSITAIDTGALHAGIFLKILERIPPTKLPKLVVVDLNIRSFGANWLHSNLENALQRNFVYWNKRPSVLNHFLAATKWYDYRSPAEHIRAIEYEEKFEKLPFPFPQSSIKHWVNNLAADKPNREQAATFIRHFGFLIKPGNDQLNNYQQLIQWSKQHGVKLIFLMLPENIEGMKEVVGEELSDLVSLNAKFLNHYFRKQGQVVIDLHNALGKEQFFEQFPTEHYRSAGRKMVGEAIAAWINEKLSK